MSAFAPFFFILCVFHLFDYGRSVFNENDLTLVQSHKPSYYKDYVTVVPFENMLSLVVFQGEDGCNFDSVMCICAVPVFGDIVKPGFETCADEDSALCVDFSFDSGRLPEATLLSNPKYGSSYYKLVFQDDFVIHISLDTGKDKHLLNVTKVKVGNSLSDKALVIGTWRTFMKKDSDNYGMVNYVKLKVTHPEAYNGCPAYVRLKNGAKWLQDASSLFRYVFKPPNNEEEDKKMDEEVTIRSVAVASFVKSVNFHKWTVCIVGPVIWIIWTVIYITILALAFNRRLCFTLIDPPEIVKNVQFDLLEKNS